MMAIALIRQYVNSLLRSNTPLRAFKYNLYSHYAFLFFVPFALTPARWYAVPASFFVALLVIALLAAGHTDGLGQAPSTVNQMLILKALTHLPRGADRKASPSLISSRADYG